MGHHTWRQTTSAGMAYCYYLNALNPWQPQILNRNVADGKTVGEFPIFYYLAAVGYRFFGFHHAILRLLHLLVYFLALYAIFQISLFFIKDLWLSLATALLFFVAPLLVFYGNNYTADVPAWSLAIIGTGMYIAYKQHKKHKYLFAAVFLYSLAGLLKPHALMAAAAMGLSEWICLYKTPTDMKNTPAGKLYLIILIVIIPLLITLSWIVISLHYNQQTGAKQFYFLTSIKPIWKLTDDPDLIKYILKRTSTEWLSYFSSRPMGILIVVGLAMCLITWKRNKVNILFWCSILSLAMSCTYFLLFYEQFLHHDYYLIPFYTAVLFVILLLHAHITISFPKYLWIYKTLIVGVVIYSAIYTSQKMKKLYSLDYFEQNPVFLDEELIPYLRNLGIKKEDYVISFPDKSCDATLYYMLQPGFNQYYERTITKELLAEYIRLGAKYLIINDTTIITEAGIEGYLSSPIGTYQCLKIYSL